MCNNEYSIGEVYWMFFDGEYNEQRGTRPGIIFQNNIGNKYSPNIIALPLTTNLKKISQPTHVLVLAEESGLPKDSVVLCEGPERMSKERIGDYITTIPRRTMAKIAAANLLATSAISFINPDHLFDIWEIASNLNKH